MRWKFDNVDFETVNGWISDEKEREERLKEFLEFNKAYMAFNLFSHASNIGKSVSNDFLDAEMIIAFSQIKDCMEEESERHRSKSKPKRKG